MEVTKKRIGFLLAVKKAEALGLLGEVKNMLEKCDVDVVEINNEQTIENQGPFNIIIHKISDLLRDAEAGDISSINKIRELREYEEKYRDTCILLDSTEVVFQLADRSLMSEICEKACYSSKSGRIYVPKWIKIDSKNNISEIIENLRAKEIRFPIICKALNAAEGPGAHDMQLLFDESQIDQLVVIPCIAQDFVNHDMKMLKIFVCGDSWCVVNRPSIKNFDSNPVNYSFLKKADGQMINHSPRTNGFHENDSNKYESIVFNSHDVSKPDSVSFLNDYGKSYKQVVSFGNNEHIDDSVVKEIISELRSVIPFTLLGIDLIINDENYGLIDINFLPGYDGMSNFNEEFFKLLSLKLNVVSNTIDEIQTEMQQKNSKNAITHEVITKYFIGRKSKLPRKRIAQ